MTTFFPPYICYNWMALLADHVLDFSKDFFLNIGAPSLHDRENFLPESVKPYDLIYVKTDFIINGSFMSDYLPRITEPFNLITGNSDYHISRDGGLIYRHLLDSPLLHRWVCTNPPDVNNRKIIPFPIGFQEPARAGGSPAFLQSVLDSSTPFDQKEDIFFLPYHDTTSPERVTYINYLKELPFVRAQSSKQLLPDYYKSMDKYKFVISLEGNGPDCHRNYEIMLTGSIPVNFSSVVQCLFKFYSLAWVGGHSWFDLNDSMFREALDEGYSLQKNAAFITTDFHVRHLKRALDLSRSYE